MIDSNEIDLECDNPVSRSDSDFLDGRCRGIVSTGARDGGGVEIASSRND